MSEEGESRPTKEANIEVIANRGPFLALRTWKKVRGAILLMLRNSCVELRRGEGGCKEERTENQITCNTSRRPNRKIRPYLLVPTLIAGLKTLGPEKWEKK